MAHWKSITKRVKREDAGSVIQVKRSEGIDAPGGTSLEMRVYRALIRAGWKKEQIAVQFEIQGGRAVKGGQVVDIVLYTPRAIPIRVQGEWWHQDGGQEMWEAAKINEEFGMMPVDIWGKEAETDEQALATVLAKVGRP